MLIKYKYSRQYRKNSDDKKKDVNKNNLKKGKLQVASNMLVQIRVLKYIIYIY